MRTLIEQRDEARRARDRARARAEELTAQLEASRRPVPSFAASLARERRLLDLTRREHGVLPPVWQHNSKTAGRRLATSVGVEVPELLAGPASIDELELRLDRAIVVKPSEGSTSRGVVPLVPLSDGRALSVFDGVEVDASAVRNALRTAASDPRVGRSFLIEELLPASRADRYLPDDWKLYVFGGRVELVMQRDVHDQTLTSRFRFRWYDRAGTDLGPIRRERHDPTLPPATDHAALVAAAEAVAGAVPAAFVRIDLFQVGRRTVFGELTPLPGGEQRFGDGHDERLGQAWERAEAARLAAGYIDPSPSSRG